MRILRLAILLSVGLGVLGLDAGESLRAGALRVGTVHAAKHRRHHHRKHARKRHRKHHRRTAPATEM